MAERHAINLSTAWCPPAAAAEAWVRRFGRPDGVEQGDVIWLVVESAGGCRLALNAASLPTVPPGGVLRHAVTGLLGPRNELQLSPLEGRAALPVGESACPNSHGRSPLPDAMARVRLEIESRTLGGLADLP
ncbi:MAG: hypothetical protein RLZZ440_2792 [Planctomycetota bacterium]|jgi:hypothetical protein